MKALFLDRDGVINERIVGGYVRSPKQFRLIEDIVPIIQMAQQANYLVIVVSNQQGVGKGLMTEMDLHSVHKHMNEVLDQRGVGPFDLILVCTSLKEENDPRRKPNPGMILEAIEQFDLNPDDCWFLGDMPSDAQAGKTAGIHTALLGSYSLSEADIVATDHQQMLALFQTLFVG